MRGFVKVVTESDDSATVASMKVLRIRLVKDVRNLDVEKVVVHDRWLSMKLAGVDDRDTAALLSGGEVIVPRSELAELSDNEYYIDDLVGCRVVTETGEEAGVLSEVWPQGHHDLWVVDDDGKEILIPAVSEHIRSVDVERHLIVVRTLDGLRN